MVRIGSVIAAVALVGAACYSSSTDGQDAEADARTDADAPRPTDTPAEEADRADTDRVEDGSIDEVVCPVPDRDGDGFAAIGCGGSDCNDDDPTTYPGAPDNVGRWRIEDIDEGRDSTAIRVDGADVVHVAYLGYDADWSACLFYARREGDAWTIEAVDSTAAWSPVALILDAAGDPHIAYRAENDGGTVHLRHAVPEPGGWRTEAAGRPPLDDVVGSLGMAFDRLGRLHIAYHGREPAGFSILRHAFLMPGGWMNETIDPAENSGRGASLAIDGSGTLHALYLQDGRFTSELRHAFLTGPAWNAETLATAYSGDRTSVVVDGADVLHVHFPSETAYATNASGDWTFERVDPGLSPAGGGDLAVDSAGTAHVAYTVPGFDFSFGLRYGRRTADGWNVELVQPEVLRAPDGISIAVDAAGDVHITYQRGSGIGYATTRGGTDPDGVDQDCDGVDG